MSEAHMDDIKPNDGGTISIFVGAEHIRIATQSKMDPTATGPNLTRGEAEHLVQCLTKALAQLRTQQARPPGAIVIEWGSTQTVVQPTETV